MQRMLTYAIMNTRSPRQSKSSEPEYYTVQEAAKLLKVSPSTVWRWIDAGRLRAHRVGARGIRIDRRVLETAIVPLGCGEPRLGEPTGLWAGYDPRLVEEALAETAGSWADGDPDELIAAIYRAREEGSRPAGRS